MDELNRLLMGPYPVPGNIDLNNRPMVRNPDGSISTVRSMSYQNDRGEEVLIPTVSNEGTILPDRQAIEYWLRRQQYLGKFADPQSADAYAQALHEAQAQQYMPQNRLMGH